MVTRDDKALLGDTRWLMVLRGMTKLRRDTRGIGGSGRGHKVARLREG